MFAQLVQAFLRVGEGRFSEHPLTFTPGQIVIGEVVRTLSDREVVVKIHNQTFRAVTEVPLKAQTHHWFQVQSDPDHLVLKVVTDRNTAKQFVPPTVPALLKSWGLKVTRQRVEAANFFIQHDLPLTRQSLEQLATVWLRLGQSVETERAVLLSLAKRLPLKVPIVSAIHQFTSGTSLTSQLSRLKQLLQQWVKTGSTLDSNTKAEVASALKQIEAVIGFNTHRLAQGSAKSTATPHLQGGTHSVVTARHTYAPDGETAKTAYGLRPGQTSPDALHVPRSTPSHPTAQGRTSTYGIPDWPSQSAAGSQSEPPVTVPFIQKWLKTIGVDREWNVFRLIRSLPDRPSHSALAGETSVSSLKESLMRLLQLPIPPHARKVAENAVQYITGQQLLLSTPHDANWQYVLLHLPLYAAEGRDASVHVWTRRTSKGKLDQDNCRVMLQLELERLGPSCLIVHIVDRVVHVEWYSDDIRLEEQMRPFESDLRERLAATGYRLSNVTVYPLSQQREKVNAAVYPLTLAGKKGVDIRI